VIEIESQPESALVKKRTGRPKIVSKKPADAEVDPNVLGSLGRQLGMPCDRA
jgi:hypothetical protein